MTEGQLHIIAMVCARSGVSLAALLETSRGAKPIADARAVAMYLCNVALNRSLTKVGQIFGRDRTTVAHASARIEDMREELLELDVFCSDIEKLCAENYAFEVAA